MRVRTSIPKTSYYKINSKKCCLPVTQAYLKTDLLLKFMKYNFSFVTTKMTKLF